MFQGILTVVVCVFVKYVIVTSEYIAYSIVDVAMIIRPGRGASEHTATTNAPPVQL